MRGWVVGSGLKLNMKTQARISISGGGDQYRKGAGFDSGLTLNMKAPGVVLNDSGGGG